MNKQEKAIIIDELKQVLTDNNIVYLADTEGLNAKQTSEFRRACFKNNITVRVIKNTLLKIAMDSVEGKDYSELETALIGNTTMLISDTGNAPAKLIKDFRKKEEKPLIKGAWIEESVYLGDENIDNLVNIKSKEELIGEIIGLLQSPIKNVVSSLQSGGSTIAGIVKTLSEKE